MGKDILLSTLNSSYFHSSFGLRYLFANMEELQERTEILELTTQHNTRDIAELLLAKSPEILGLGVYIWNTRQTYDLVSLLKRIRPSLKIVLGGPEVSYESESQALCQIADHTIKGESDFLFRDFCRNHFLGKPIQKFVSGPLPEIQKIRSPYAFYTDEDIEHRVVYVEASRGCPYKCEFCLSSLDKEVRTFDLDAFLVDMETLIERGNRQFKFVDRTFNLNFTTSRKILEFFLKRIDKGLFLHFEMVPDRLPIELQDLIRQFPEGSLQFEIGVQTFTPDVAKRVSRQHNVAKTRENFHFLTEKTSVHIHSDLIVGLPGETLETFRMSFDALHALKPHEIQVGILKRLKGTPIIRHDKEWKMVYQEDPPFTVLSTATMPYDEVQRLTRFAKFWDLYSNSGNFRETMVLIEGLSPSLFDAFFEFVKYLEKRHPQRHSIALLSLVESVWIYLTEEKGLKREKVRAALIRDYAGPGKRSVPAFLEEVGDLPTERVLPQKKNGATPKRQGLHLKKRTVNLQPTL